MRMNGTVCVPFALLNLSESKCFDNIFGGGIIPKCFHPSEYQKPDDAFRSVQVVHNGYFASISNLHLQLNSAISCSVRSRDGFGKFSFSLPVSGGLFVLEQIFCVCLRNEIKSTVVSVWCVFPFISSLADRIGHVFVVGALDL